MMDILKNIQRNLPCSMKRILLFSLLCLPQLTFADSATNFEGLWQEVTLYDDSEIIEGRGAISVDDTEYYWVSKYHNQLLINSVSSADFSISQVKQQNNILKFTMLNALDPNEIYVLKYECREIYKNTELKCQFTNQKGEIEKNIFWKKRSRMMK